MSISLIGMVELVSGLPLVEPFREWVEHVRSYSPRYSDKEVKAHSDRQAELIDQIADTPADNVLAFAIKSYLLAHEDRDASAIDLARPNLGEDWSKSTNSGSLSESLLRDIQALAPQIEEILGPVPFAEAAE